MSVKLHGGPNDGREVDDKWRGLPVLVTPVPWSPVQPTTGLANYRFDAWLDRFVYIGERDYVPAHISDARKDIPRCPRCEYLTLDGCSREGCPMLATDAQPATVAPQPTEYKAKPAPS